VRQIIDASARVGGDLVSGMVEAKVLSKGEMTGLEEVYSRGGKEGK